MPLSLRSRIPALMVLVPLCVATISMQPTQLAHARASFVSEEGDTPKITDPVTLSLAAGYKATFTCSSIFNARRSVTQINGDELNRIYPDFRDAFAQLPPADIDMETGIVSVRYSDNFPPRHAKWRGNLGCAQMPTGASLSSFEWPSAKPSSNSVDAALLSKKKAKDAKKSQRRLAWPAGDKLQQSPSAKTVPGQKIYPVIDQAFDRQTYGEETETTAVLIIHNGDIIGERYRDGFDMHTPQRTWSVAKSIAASVIGAAVKDGIINIDETADLSQWPQGDPRRGITLENMLHMASGLDNGPRGNRTDAIYFGGGRVVDHAATRQLIVEPGTRWYYANNDTMLAMRFLRERMADDEGYQSYPFTAVFNKLGMYHTFPEADWNGDFIMSSQVYTTARDLGRLGLLYLNEGIWNGERLLPDWWIDYITMPAPAQPPLRADGSKRFGYGAQWWLLGGFADLPDDTYTALGNRGQSLTLIPSRNLIIIRRGFDDNGGNQFDVAQFASDIAGALAE